MLGWVLNGKAGEALLDSYTPERRGATLDVFANASKSARFMTPNTHGWQLMRDAALSLALTHAFAGELANPRQMTAFSYHGSPAVLPDDPAFTGGPGVGTLLPEVKLGDDFLSDRLGEGFTVVCFEAKFAQQIAALGPDTRWLSVVAVPRPSRIADKFAAHDRSAYLVRRDMHIAGRWHEAIAEDVIAGFRAVTFQQGTTR